MTLEKLITAWQLEPTIAGNFSDWRILPARKASLNPLPAEIHPHLAAVLRQRGITNLYTHQSSAWECLQSQQHIVVVTGTASGKTLCYNLPIIDGLLRQPEATALYLFPTKALTQDQFTALHDIVNELDHTFTKNPPDSSIPVAIYDGDTPSHQRQIIRKQARLLLTNPDMLHIGILPHHTNWMRFFRQLRFVVIDEIHTYRGVFGSHLANVIRRLKRISRYYGAHPQFILTSATIANPEEYSARLIEETCTVLSEDGSKRGEKFFLIYNPPIIDRDLGLRRSALQESVRLADDLLTYNVQSIIFARSRRTVEIILTYLREKFKFSSTPMLDANVQNSDDAPESIIRGYRSGYLPEERRAVERGLRQGHVRAVVATNALELGIDIGELQAAVMVGYPGTIAATWQQAGRSGRGESSSLAILITTPDPLDQFLASHPNYVFERTPEHALINPDNPLILLHHLRCAAFELPFSQEDHFEGLDAAKLKEYLEILLEQHVLYRSKSKYYWMADQYPAQGISLRSITAQPVLLKTVDEYGNSQTIGQVDRSSAVWLTHPQAIYLHEGQPFMIEELDLERGLAQLTPTNVDYYTLPSSQSAVQLMQQFDQDLVPGGLKAQGELLVTSQVKGFRKIRWHTHEILGFGELDLPPTELITTGYWLALDQHSVEQLRDAGMWRNDENQYGPGWDKLRQLARRRDGFQCQVCGASEGNREHNVHHKIPFRTFTNRDQANRLENLITLCSNCHQRVESAVRVRSGLAGMGYVLHHLAPFFLMCDTSDLGVHSDPQLTLLPPAENPEKINVNGTHIENSFQLESMLGIHAKDQPGIVLYDQIPAGIGFSQRLYQLHDVLLKRALELVQSCLCLDGCPSCVGPGGEQGLGGKDETIAILKIMT